MAISYPTSLDSLTNPTPGDGQNSPLHTDQHANANDAIEALEAKVGADSSAVTSSHDYKIAQLESTRELTANKENSTIDTSTTKYPTVNLLKTGLDAKLALAGGTMTGDIAMGDQNITGIGSASFTQELDNGSKTASFSIDFSTDQKQKVTLTANTMTITLDTTDIKVGNYLLKIVNGGLATITWAAETGSILWAGGAVPTFTSSGTDLLTAYWDGTNFYLAASLGFATV